MTIAKVCPTHWIKENDKTWKKSDPIPICDPPHKLVQIKFEDRQNAPKRLGLIISENQAQGEYFCVEINTGQKLKDVLGVDDRNYISRRRIFEIEDLEKFKNEKPREKVRQEAHLKAVQYLENIEKSGLDVQRVLKIDETSTSISTQTDQNWPEGSIETMKLGTALRYKERALTRIAEERKEKENQISRYPYCQICIFKKFYNKATGSQSTHRIES